MSAPSPSRGAPAPPGSRNGGVRRCQAGAASSPARTLDRPRVRRPARPSRPRESRRSPPPRRGQLKPPAQPKPLDPSTVTHPRRHSPPNAKCSRVTSGRSFVRRGIPEVMPGGTHCSPTWLIHTTNRCVSFSRRTAATTSRTRTATVSSANPDARITRAATSTAGCSDSEAKPYSLSLLPRGVPGHLLLGRFRKSVRCRPSSQRSIPWLSEYQPVGGSCGAGAVRRAIAMVADLIPGSAAILTAA